MRTKSQRLEALDTLLQQARNEAERRPNEQIFKIVELLAEYRSWNDAPADGDEAFLTIHDNLEEQFAELLSRTRGKKVAADILRMAIETMWLLDSVPWQIKGPARLVAAARRELSISTWAERISTLPDGPLRDLAAYPLDIVHVTLGDHHGGEQCRVVAMSFSDGGTVVSRTIGPVYSRLLERVS